MAGTAGIAGGSEETGGHHFGVTAAKRALIMKKGSSARRPLTERSKNVGAEALPRTPPTRPHTPPPGAAADSGRIGKASSKGRAYQTPAASPVPAAERVDAESLAVAKPQPAQDRGQPQSGAAADVELPPAEAEPRPAEDGDQSQACVESPPVVAEPQPASPTEAAAAQAGGGEQEDGLRAPEVLDEENKRLKARVLEVALHLKDALLKAHDLELERDDLEVKKRNMGERRMELAERCGHLEDQTGTLVEGLRIKDMHIAELEHELYFLRRQAFDTGLMPAGQIIRATSIGEIRHVIEPVSEESEWVSSPQQWISPSRPSPPHQSPGGSPVVDSPLSIGGFYPGPVDSSYRCSTPGGEFIDSEAGRAAAGGRSEHGTVREAARMVWTSSKVTLGCLLVAVGYNYLSELYLKDYDYI